MNTATASRFQPSRFPLRLTLLSRQDCHLCHVVARVVEQVRQDTPFEFDTIDIDGDPTLAARYGHRVPVVLIDGEEACSGKVTAGTLRTALQKARWKNPISRILSRVKLALTRG